MAASGTFTLKYGISTSSADNTTTALPVAASARELERVLNGLKVVRDNGGSLAVTRTGNNFLISFGGNLAGYDQTPLVQSGSATAATIFDGVILLEGVPPAG